MPHDTYMAVVCHPMQTRCGSIVEMDGKEGHEGCYPSQDPFMTRKDTSRNTRPVLEVVEDEGG